jgi:hypothetical protein
VVAASAEVNAAGIYRYAYRVQILRSSGQPLARFVVQNFAPDVKPRTQSNLHIGVMGKNVPEFSTGDWRSFAPLTGHVPVGPGRTCCRAGVEGTARLGCV